jgi:hypothetical protein
MATAEDFLAHYGVKGMKWGVRKDDSGGGHRFQGPTKTTALPKAGPAMDGDLHSATKAGGAEVAKLMGDRYGFKITAIKDLGKTHPHEVIRGTVGFVEVTPGRAGGVMHIQNVDVRAMLKDAEKTGWMNGTGNVRGLVTHEAAHAMFHAEQHKSISIWTGATKTKGGQIEKRDVALKAGMKEAKRNGISARNFAGSVSGYAKTSGMREELEAEMFSQYHWHPNPPSHVRVWGETLHRELGVDATPFREVVKNG